MEDYSHLKLELAGKSAAIPGADIKRSENNPEGWKAAGSRTGVLANDYNEWDIGACTDVPPSTTCADYYANGRSACTDCTETYSQATRKHVPNTGAANPYAEAGPNYNVFPHPQYELGQRHFVFKPIEKNEGRPATDLKANLNWAEDGVSPYCEAADSTHDDGSAVPGWFTGIDHNACLDDVDPADPLGEGYDAGYLQHGDSKLWCTAGDGTCDLY